MTNQPPDFRIVELDRGRGQDAITIPQDYRQMEEFKSLTNICRQMLEDVAHQEQRVREEVAKDFSSAEEILKHIRCGLTISNIACCVWAGKLEVEVEKPEPGTIILHLDSVGPRVAPGWVSYDIVGWKPKPSAETVQLHEAIRTEIYGEHGQWGAD